jgi:hypothetical protein
LSSSFKSLQQAEERKSKEPLDRLLNKCRGKNFYEFYDIIGRQEKHGRKLGVLSYETTLLRTLEQNNHVCVIKPVGCGITHFSIMFAIQDYD